jgi:hypothetical protein
MFYENYQYLTIYIFSITFHIISFADQIKMRSIRKYKKYFFSQTKLTYEIYEDIVFLQQK